ncbi:MAG: iron-containing redox enzyme family protein [Candidatus Gracilibacteria bacterium]|nr:iron-containing redox enzyme family protein [Candidatus Gracilibacteria bacterium]
MLPNLEDLDQNKSRTIIKRQVAAFEGNFVVWLSSILITAKANKTKEETLKNLSEELEGNHAGLLRSFAKSGNALPDKNDFDYLENEISMIRELVSEMSGLKNLVLLTVLEDTAPNCMAIFQKAAKLINADDTRYADMHYELDVEHSQDFKDSLIKEIQYYDNPEPLIDDAINKSLGLLKKIWTL